MASVEEHPEVSASRRQLLHHDDTSSATIVHSFFFHVLPWHMLELLECSFAFLCAKTLTDAFDASLLFFPIASISGSGR